MWSIVEKQDMAVRQDGRRVLAGKRGCTELPVDLPCPTIEHHNGRDIAETEHNIAVRQFTEPVRKGPPVAIVLHGCYAVYSGIEMLPALPLPHDLSVCRHLYEVVADDLAVVDFGTGTTASGSGFLQIRRTLPFFSRMPS